MLSTGFTHIIQIQDTEKIEYHQLLSPGQRMRVSVQMKNFQNDCVTFSGKGLVGNQEIVSLQNCSAILVPLADFLDPEDMKTLFSEIFKPEAGVAT